MKKILSLLMVLCAFASFGGNVTLTWNQNSETNLAGYYVYAGTTSGSYASKNFVAYPNNTNVVANLSGGLTYYFAVSATNVAGIEGARSTEVSVGVPNTPTNVTATFNLDNNTMLLTWPTNNILQYSSNLVPALWIDIATNSPYVFDTTSQPMGFFRLRSYIPPPITNQPVVVPPVGLASLSTGISTTSLAKVTLSNVPTNSFVVLTAASETAQISSAVTSLPPLAWTRSVKASAASSGDVELWAAQFNQGGSLVITNVWNSTNKAVSVVAYAFTNASLNKQTLSAVNQSLPNVTLAATQTNGYFLAVSSDWYAKSGTITYLNQPVTVALVHTVASKYQAAHWYKRTTNAVNYTMGESAPTGQGAGTIVFEVKGN